MVVYKSKYQAIKQKEQLDLKINTARQLHELRRYKWQDNTNLYENQRWNQVLRKGKNFILRMRHLSWCPLCRIKEWNELMTTISWLTDVISHGGHWDTKVDEMIYIPSILHHALLYKFYIN